MEALPYVPFGAGLRDRPHVFVDGLRTPSTVLELSHWPGNRTPAPLKADVSTQSVLRLLGRPAADRERLLAGATAVTCDHYDVDGLLSVLCLVDPEFAWRHRGLLEATALCGDFDVHSGDPAVRACLALLAAEREISRATRFRSVEQATTALFRGMLDVAEACLLDPGAWRDAWAGEWEDVERSLRSATEFEEHGDLAVFVDTDRPAHEYAVHARTDAGHVLRLRRDGRHSLRFRYENFVDLQSRRPAPRVRGDLLARELNARERDGTWFCESPATATPLLQLYAGDEVPAPSSLGMDEVRRVVVAFFEAARADGSLLWRPTAGWVHEAAGTPPSKEAGTAWHG
ncbi:hypothetical protein AGRA3207_003276 [Actinomadura graeca]|uniref:Uncharacterized protein n=1 Tax=Actinomadura graeca TaxID=2750812 RepID=A0ABX8QVR3_9ACTN|nr:DUF6687 family protein [Actinomadura graeca]QXJ22294.1 hypothetical protein AGRA3207_003276 [Actinomadura graeca]